MKNLLKICTILALFFASVAAHAESTSVTTVWPHSITYSYTQGSGKVKGNSYNLVISPDNVKWAKITKGVPGEYESAQSAILVKLDGDDYMISWFETKKITVTMVFNTKLKSINTISSTSAGNNLTSGQISEINW